MRLGALLIRVLSVAVLLWLEIPSANAQAILAGGTIEEIRVEGTQRIEPATVASYLQISPGDEFDPIALDNALKNLFATGLFADVTLRREGSTLIVRVVENQIINRVAFEGNKRIDDESLAAEVEVRPRTVLTRTKVQNDVQRILDLYRQQGRFAATVEPKLIELPQNRVDVVFEIDEGETTGIKSINFIGNREFSDSKLRGEILTTETAFWRFLTSTDTYDPDRLTFDRELLRRFYLSKGYADFRVLSAVAELAPERDGFFITFTVEEGERYTFGPIDIQTSLRNLDPESLRGAVVTEEGDWYDAEEVEETVENLSEQVGNLGFAFVQVRPRVDQDRENRIISLTYDIDEGPKVFIERIDIVGNVRTLDRVIRREFRLVEGDAFNAAQLRRSRERIQNLGFFKSVEVTNEESEEPDKTIVTVEVEEQSTGDLTFGAGFSSAVGPLGSIGIRERNLLGKGQDLQLNFLLAGRRSQLDLSFTEPYFLDRDLAAGFDLYHISTEQRESSFDETRTGGALRGGYNLSERIRQRWRYNFERRKIDNVDDNASLIVKLEEGTSNVSAVSHELTYDSRDNRFDPTEGFVVRLENEVAGLGGDVHYLKNSIGGDYFFPVFEDTTLRLGGDAGHIFGLGEDTRISDRFFIGSSSFRGFEFGGVGPRDAITGDSLGGEQYYVGTVELTFPLGLPEEFGIKGRVFSEFGAVWGVPDISGVDIDDSSSPRVTLGAGFSWNSPLGPFVLDIGVPVVKEDFDKEELLFFSVGTRF